MPYEHKQSGWTVLPGTDEARRLKSPLDRAIARRAGA